MWTSILALGLGAASPAWASCDQTGASQADQDLWNVHGCWSDFYLWQYQAYNMSSNDWSSRGWNDACNVNKEFPKHWNAAYLVTYGMGDNGTYSFHGTVDYRATAEGPSSDYHPEICHQATDATNIYGSYSTSLFSCDKVKTSCLLYDSWRSNAHPASRAGDFMHEGWHGWMNKHGYNNGSYGGHRAMQGACTDCDCCDYFYWHGIGDFAFGAMWEDDGTPNRFHSPNQVQVEFLCDVSDYPQSWVPASVRTSAALDANSRAAGRFINGPGYSCGDPRPW